MGWFFRRPVAPRDRDSYPQPGYVTIVSGDLQEWEFVRDGLRARTQLAAHSADDRTFGLGLAGFLAVTMYAGLRQVSRR